MQKKHISLLFDTLHDFYPDATTELQYHTPFQLMIAVIMSAQTTDKQVNKVTATLFQSVKHPQDVVNMGLESYQEKIKSIGLYKNKSRNIYKLSTILISQGYQRDIDTLTDKEMSVYHAYGYYISADWQKLQKLPGIGEKTAKVIVHVLYDVPVIAVDTHVHRVSNRLGLVATNSPAQTSKQLAMVVPDNYKSAAHHGLILFGRYHCTARNPKCDTCPFTGFCQYYREVIRK